MEYSLARNWWVLALRGALAIVFGVLVFFWPEAYWIVLVSIFAAFAMLDGALALATVFTGGAQGRWWALMLEGLLGIAIGVLTLIWPEITMLALLYFIAAWAIVTGVFEVVAAIELRKEIEGEWLLALSGVLSVLFGVALVALPGPGFVAIAWLIASYSIAFGVLMLALGFRLRGLARHVTSPGAVPMR